MERARAARRQRVFRHGAGFTHIIFLASFLSLQLWGCSSSSSDPDRVNFSDYYPMTKAAYRSYKIQTSDPLTGGVAVITVTDVLTSGATYNGIASIRTCRSPDGPWADDVAFGGSITRMVSVGPPPVPVVPGVPSTPTSVPLHPGFPRSDGPITLGVDPWEVNQPLQSTPSVLIRANLGPVAVTVTVTFRRREPVTVEGGVFSDSIVVNFSLTSPELGIALTQTDWYARDVGLVKVVSGDSGTATDPPVWELVDHGMLSSPAPKLLSIAPSSGPLAGGSEVVLGGEFFAPDAKVMFGYLPATSVTFESPTVIRAVTPAAVAGPADVTVANADCQVSILDDAFTFQ